MSENIFLQTSSKKRKIEYVFQEDNTNDFQPLISHDCSHDNQQTESQQAATELLDLTLFEEPQQRNTDEETWKQITLDTVKDMLKEYDNAEYDVPLNFLAKFDLEGKYQGIVKCDNKKCKPFVSRDTKSKNYRCIQTFQKKSIWSGETHSQFLNSTRNLTTSAFSGKIIKSRCLLFHASH